MSGTAATGVISAVGDAQTAPDAAKRYFHGTHRICEPEETLERLRPLLPAMGITRIANVTGLDRTGIPVVMVCRPNARSVAVSQGKGLTLAAAKASGVMEALEVWHAEHIVRPLKLASFDEMRAEHRVADVNGLPRSRNSRFTAGTPLLWIEGDDLLGSARVWVPFELVSADYTLPFPPGSGCFQANTNGLASGNHWLEAVSHGLCEVVERDARTLWKHRSPGAQTGTAVDSDSIDDAACSSVIGQYRAAGLEVRIWDTTTDVGIASFVCLLVGCDGDDADPEFGSGCHPARHIALLRALTEAGQARNTYIAGARDDYFPHLYSRATRARRQALCRRLLDTSTPQRAYAHAPHFESPSIDGDLRWMLARLRAAGIEQVVAVDLTREAVGVPVARVIVPGLEGAMNETDSDYAPGPRALRYLKGGMNACIFAGPTLPPRDEARSFAATWLPPAKHGDVYRAVSLLQPRAIGIVDGYFQWVPSVWHKEILWAIHQGVHVFGAASMGALRAVELAPFGMRGVGRIFEAYRNGVFARGGEGPFEDDDEVAVVHGPPESGYIAASEAMVNIRCTLAAAESTGVIAATTRARLIAIAKAVFFPDRSYELMVKHARTEALPEDQLAALEAWLPSGRVDQKRIDALAMIETMQNFLARDLTPAQPNFSFQHTSFWELAFARAHPATVHSAEDTRVLEELRIEGARWDTLRAEALALLVSTGTAEARVSPEALASSLADHRGQPHEIERLLEEAARMQAVRRTLEETPPAIVERQMLVRIRATEEFERLRVRAEDKLARVARASDLPDIEDFSELQLLQLRDWYFSRVLGWDMPDDVEQRARAWGYRDLPDFHRAIFTEYVYRELTDTQETDGDGAAGLAENSAP